MKNTKIKKFGEKLDMAFAEVKEDIIKNITTLVKSGKEVPESLSVSFTVNFKK